MLAILMVAPAIWAFATQEPTFTIPPAVKLPGNCSYGVLPSSSRYIPIDIAAQPEVQTMYRRLANSTLISATSFPPFAKLEQPTNPTTPGISPSTMGPPTLRISISWIAPLPVRITNFSFFIFSAAAATINECTGIFCVQACSHLAHPTQASYKAERSERSPSPAAFIPCGIARSLGHALWQSRHCVQSEASSRMVSGEIAVEAFLRAGITVQATRTATSPAFSGSRIRTPFCRPVVRSATMASAGSFVRSGRPMQFLSDVAMNGVPTAAASENASVRTHCSSTTITSGIPLRMYRIYHDMGPIIFARGEYLLASIEVQQIPVTST